MAFVEIQIFITYSTKKSYSKLSNNSLRKSLLKQIFMNFIRSPSKNSFSNYFRDSSNILTKHSFRKPSMDVSEIPAWISLENHRGLSSEIPPQRLSVNFPGIPPRISLKILDSLSDFLPIILYSMDSLWIS